VVHARKHTPSGIIGKIELGFVEREMTPRLLMKFDIYIYFAGLSVLNTVSILGYLVTRSINRS
jgi:hypothetical protein